MDVYAQFEKARVCISHPDNKPIHAPVLVSIIDNFDSLTRKHAELSAQINSLGFTARGNVEMELKKVEGLVDNLRRLFGTTVERWESKYGEEEVAKILKEYCFGCGGWLNVGARGLD